MDTPEQKEKTLPSTQKDSGNGEKQGCVFLVNIPGSSAFKLTMMRTDRDSLSKKEKDRVCLISETLQNVIADVGIYTNRAGSKMEITALNAEVPGSDCLMRTEIPSLIAEDGTSQVEVYNFDKHGEMICVETYVISDITISITRSYSDTGLQKFVISAKIDKEVVDASL